MAFYYGSLYRSHHAVTQMVYAMVTDKAQHNEESVTKAFGLIGAAFGVGFILGPSIGSYLSNEFCELV